MQAALHGQGVTLGWGHMLHDLLRDGELVRLTSTSIAMRDAYYAVLPHGRSLTPAISALIDWLRADLAYAPGA